MAGAQGEDLRSRNIGELFKQLSRDVAILVRKEIELAKAELTEQGKKAGKGAGMVGAAGVMGFLALAALTTCFILVLATVMPHWLAALIVAAVHGAIAVVLGLRGKERVHRATPPAPQTVETVKEDVQWAKHPTSSAKR
jgi:uncharacterized membrane protein YqjE